MTEKDAKRAFCEIAPKGKDRPKFHEAWSGYVDNLVRDGRVSEARAKRWRGPQRCGKPGTGFGAPGRAPALAGTREQHRASAGVLVQQAERYANGVASEPTCAGAVDKLVHAAGVMGAAGRDHRWATGGPITDVAPSNVAAAEIALERAKSHVVKKCGRG